MNHSDITFDGDEMRIDFQRFDQERYQLFLKAKRLPEYRIRLSDPDALHYTITAPARFATMLGIPQPKLERDPLPIPDFLFDDQRIIVTMAKQAKRFACWSDCGLGKTLIGLEWARQIVHSTGGRVLIVTLNEIVNQWIEEAQKFYGLTLAIARLETRADMKAWCAGGESAASIAVVNYEKFNHKTEGEQVVSELKHLAGIVLDESSRLKTGGGRQKWALIKSAKGIQYKLSLTATPAPNEIMEFASQASFLEKLHDENEIIWTYFRRDEKTHRWTVKPHARKAFFEFMAGWSIYVRDPRRYGWRVDVPVPPEPIIHKHDIKPTDEQRQFIIDHNQKLPAPAGDRSGTGQMFATETNATTSIRLSEAAKGFVYDKDDSGKRIIRPIASAKPAFIADLIRKDVAKGLQVLVWTVFDEEGEIISRELKKACAITGQDTAFDLLTGKTSETERLRILDDFRGGDIRVLISRASMLGYGMNLQFVGSMIFSGWSFSYEQFYHAVRRAYRHGQKRRLRVHIPVIAELEGQMYDAICRKDRQHEMAIEEMENNYIAAIGSVAGGKELAA